MLAGHVFVAPGPELVLVLVLICDEFLPLFSTLKIRKKKEDNTIVSFIFQKTGQSTHCKLNKKPFQLVPKLNCNFL